MPDTDVAVPDGTSQPDAGWMNACTLDHEGCVVCSDAGIPMKVVELQEFDALCEDAAGNRTVVAVELVQPLREGDILLTHGGVAIGRGVPVAAQQAIREGDHEVRR